MSTLIAPAILSGGAGTRLWPVSTDARPKQFHALARPGASLFQDTVRRLSGETGPLRFTAPIILGAAAHVDLIEAQLAQAGVEPALIVLEPMARNTAAAAAAAAEAARRLHPGALVMLAPADHLVQDAPALLAGMARAAPFAAERIVTFGITPDRPATGFGYIERGAALGEGVFAIHEFREKPDEATAKAFLAGGKHFWNAGMFLFAPELLLREFDAAPDIRTGALAAYGAGKREGARLWLDGPAFANTPSAPLDIAVMEATDFGAVVPVAPGWADLGAWDEIHRLSAHDPAGNALFGDAFAIDARDNLLRAGDGFTLAALGVDGVALIAEGGIVVAAPLARAQEVKSLLQAYRVRRGDS